MNGFGGSSSVIETNDWLYDMGLAFTPYITTDENSDYQLEEGERYFMDFDVAEIPGNLLSSMSLESIKNQFISEMRDKGHDPGTVVVSAPAINIIRVTFTANPLPLIILVALAAGIILLLSGAGAGLFVGFAGLGKGVVKIAEMPGAITREIFKNPIAVIAIIVALGIFVFGVKV